MTVIKTCDDGYNLRLISRWCKDHRHYARWYAVAYRCHARLTPTPVKNSSETYLSDWPNPKYFVDGDFFWSPTPPTTIWLVDVSPSLRTVNLYMYFYPLHNLIITPLCWSNSYMQFIYWSNSYATVNAINVNIIVWFVEHTCTDLSTYISFLLYCCKL